MRNLGKNFTTSLFAGAALLVLLTPAAGIAENKADGTVNVTIVAPVSATVTSDLVFTPVLLEDLPVTSNLLFSPVAPTGTVVVVTPEPAAEPATEPEAEGTTESGETKAEGTTESGETEPQFSANIGSGETMSQLMGTPASVAVYGEANQTYFITLPESTTFSDGVTVFDVSGFNHNAGVTPTIDPQGTGLFNIGATISSQETPQAQISQESPETQDSGESPVLVAETPGFEAGIEGPASQSGTEGTASETQVASSDSSNYSGPVVIGTPFFPVLVSYN